MTRWFVGGLGYVTLSVGSFVMLLLADRRLGVPTPYSVLLAPMVVPCIATALLCALMRMRRPQALAVLRRAAAGKNRGPRTAGRMNARAARIEGLVFFKAREESIGQAA